MKWIVPGVQSARPPPAGAAVAGAVASPAPAAARPSTADSSSTIHRPPKSRCTARSRTFAHAHAAGFTAHSHQPQPRDDGHLRLRAAIDGVAGDQAAHPAAVPPLLVRLSLHGDHRAGAAAVRPLSRRDGGAHRNRRLDCRGREAEFQRAWWQARRKGRGEEGDPVLSARVQCVALLPAAAASEPLAHHALRFPRPLLNRLPSKT